MKNSVSMLIILLVSLSTNINSQWTPSSAGMWNIPITALEISGSIVIAGTGGKGIYLSANDGVDWAHTSLTSGVIRDIVVKENNIFAGTSTGLYSSSNNGASWSQTSLGTKDVYSLVVMGDILYAGTHSNSGNAALYSSSDNGVSWLRTSLTNQNIYTLAVNRSKIYAGTTHGLFFSTNNGADWIQTSFNFGAMGKAAVDENGLVIVSSGTGVYRSTDGGITWTQAPLAQGNNYNAIIIEGNNVYLGANNNVGVYFSTNKGVTWTQTSLNKFVSALALNSTTLFAGGDIQGLYATTNNGAAWYQPALCIQDVYALAVSGNNLVAGINEACSYSNNYGAVWNYTTFNAQTPRVYSLAVVQGGFVFAGSENYGVVLSENNGSSFQYNHPLTGKLIYALTAAATNVFAGTANSGVYKSVNFGTSFTQTSLNDKTVRSLLIKDNNIFAGTENNGIYLSSDNGTSWSQTTLNNVTVRTMIVSGNNLYAGTLGRGVYFSTDNGLNWIQTSLNDVDVYSVISYGNSIFAGTSSPASFFVSTNNGLNWIQKNEGLINLRVNSLAIINNFIYAGTSSSGVFKRPINDLVGIQPVSNEIPNQYSLSQNYPNPFNPVTNVKFQIPNAGFVNLKIYDALGREITTLVNEELNPDTYEVEWDASSYPSGVYYYKLTAGSFSETKKMILIK